MDVFDRVNRLLRFASRERRYREKVGSVAVSLWNLFAKPGRSGSYEEGPLVVGLTHARVIVPLSFRGFVLAQPFGAVPSVSFPQLVGRGKGR